MGDDYQSDYRLPFTWRNATVSVPSREILKFDISQDYSREICFSRPS
jgi:hypothetical protein